MVYLLALPFALMGPPGKAHQELDEASNWGYAPACRLLSQRHLNTYPPLVASALKTHEHFENGDFIVSFSGCKVYSSQEVCNYLFLNYFSQVHGIEGHMQDPVLQPWLQG